MTLIAYDIWDDYLLFYTRTRTHTTRIGTFELIVTVRRKRKWIETKILKLNPNKKLTYFLLFCLLSSLSLSLNFICKFHRKRWNSSSSGHFGFCREVKSIFEKLSIFYSCEVNSKHNAVKLTNMKFSFFCFDLEMSISVSDFIINAMLRSIGNQKKNEIYFH